MIVRFVNTERARFASSGSSWATSDDDGLGDLHHQRHERVIVTQSCGRRGVPDGAEGRDKQVFTANLMPRAARGSSSRSTRRESLRPDRPQAQAADHDAAAGAAAEDPTTGFQLDTSSNEKILELFGESVFIRNTSTRILHA